MSSRGSALMGRTWVVPDALIKTPKRRKVNSKTMITLKIESQVLQKLPVELKPQEVRAVRRGAAMELAGEVKKNFLRLANGASRWWGQAARRTTVKEEAAQGQHCVVVAHRGVRLHLKGGTVRPTGKPSEVTGKPTKALLIPFEDSPLRKRRVSLHELRIPKEDVHVIKSAKGCPILVAGKRLKRRTNLIWLGKLVKAAHFEARPDVLPGDTEKQRAVLAGALGAMKEIYNRRKK